MSHSRRDFLKASALAVGNTKPDAEGALGEVAEPADTGPPVTFAGDPSDRVHALITGRVPIEG